jgi:uncharacterized protein (TIGR02246 family)
MKRLKGRMLIIACAFLSATLMTLVLLPPVDTEASQQAKAGIEKLHQQDNAATLSRDPKALADLWTDDGVLLEPGEQAKIGKQFIVTEVEKAIARQPGMKILTYVVDIKELKIMDEWAYEWGYFNASYKESPEAPTKSFQGKMVRIMQKQSDGSWRFARVMWNMAD